jgi:hypothetical protein
VAATGVPGFGVRVREALTDAIRYWEPRRLVFNAVLSIIVVGYFIANLPHSATVVSLDGIFFVFILAVLANICYCTAYIGDLFIQLSGFRDFWRRVRWGLFLVGVLFAAIITRWWALAFFAQAGGG